jgi:hypothetical protein
MNECSELVGGTIAAAAYDPAKLDWLGQVVPPPRAAAMFRPPAPSDPPLMDLGPPPWLRAVL